MKRTANRVVFLAVLGVLGLLVVAMLTLSQGTPSGPEGLGALASALIVAGIVVAALWVIRRVRGS